jgi:hypothetical protein
MSVTATAISKPAQREFRPELYIQALDGVFLTRYGVPFDARNAEHRVRARRSDFTTALERHVENMFYETVAT